VKEEQGKSQHRIGTRRIRSDCCVEYDDLDIGEVVGKGGEGVVCKGDWQGWEVAIKIIVIPALGIDIEEYITLASKESEIYQRLRHPHIVLFYGMATKLSSDKLDMRLAMVMELLEGSLKDVLRDYTTNIELLQVIQWLQQISRGMSYLHSRKILHRDLKPGE
jgi:serine/threonine protein kinase